MYVYTPVGSLGAGYAPEVEVATQMGEMCKGVNLSLQSELQFGRLGSCCW